MKLGKINILVLSLLMLIIYQNTSYRFDEYNRTIVLDGGHSYDIVETEDGYDLNCRMIRALPLEKNILRQGE